MTYELDILNANQETEDAIARTNAIQQAGLDLSLEVERVEAKKAAESSSERMLRPKGSTKNSTSKNVLLAKSPGRI